MKISVPKSVNKLLSNNVVLYVVMIVSLTNLIGYISLNDTISVLVFLLTGMITSYYTGNMTLILLAPIVVTNVLYGMDRQLKVRETLVESMENKTSSKKVKKDTKKTKPPSEKKKDDLDIDNKATYENFFAGLGNNVNTENLEKMTNQSKKLIESQQNLKEAMGQLTPMVDNAKILMKNLGDMGKLTGFEGFNTKNMNASIKKMMNQFMSSPSEDDAKE
jgi:hypothetical protein